MDRKKNVFLWSGIKQFYMQIYTNNGERKWRCDIKKSNSFMKIYKKK